MPQRLYTDFILHLSRPADASQACQVSVLPSPLVGELLEPIGVPREAAPPAALLEDLPAKTITQRDLVKLGKQLADCLLPEGTVRDLFRTAQTGAGYDGGVRLRLLISDPALTAWPWEYAYLNPPGATKDGLDGFLALDPRISFVRHEPLPLPHARITATAQGLTGLQMLSASAQPAGSMPLRLEHEAELLHQALDGFEVDGLRLKLEPELIDATPDALESSLRASGSIYLFHFSGHGVLDAPVSDPFNRGGRVRRGYLLLEADAQSKREVRVEAADLARWLLRAGVRLAFLNACQSGERQAEYPWAGMAGALVSHGVPAVIAMQQPVEDVASVAFGRGFYGALFSGLSLDEAVSVGRLAMMRPPEQPYFAEWGVPVLYSRLENGMLFPERVAAQGATAQTFRKVVDLQVAEIQQGGSLVGIDVGRLASGVKVSARLSSVQGSATLADIRTVDVDANLDVQAVIGTIGPGGSVTGLKVDEL